MKVINLLGGPGSGKSTCAADLFSRLKNRSISCELVTEFAKDLTWEQNQSALGCQFYVSGNQIWRQKRIPKTIKYLVTDSPIITGAFYSRNPYLEKALIEEFNQFDNMNVILNRVKPFDQKGRSQNERQSIEIHDRIKKFMDEVPYEYLLVDGNQSGVDLIEKMILEMEKINEN